MSFRISLLHYTKPLKHFSDDLSDFIVRQNPICMFSMSSYGDITIYSVLLWPCILEEYMAFMGKKKLSNVVISMDCLSQNSTLHIPFQGILRLQL